MKKIIITVLITIVVIFGLNAIGNQMSYKTVPDLHDALVVNPEKIPSETFEARVQGVKKSSVYGWGINVGDNIVITNFSRLGLHKGDKITFVVSGYSKFMDMYFINAKIYTK